jgi:acetyl-CoA carboxylase carboxyl transferase subunit alpha
LSSIKELEEQLDKCQVIGQESDVDVTTTCKQINKKLKPKKHIKNLTAWQRVQLSRHPNRPYTLDHIKALLEIPTSNFMVIEASKMIKQ